MLKCLKIWGEGPAGECLRVSHLMAWFLRPLPQAVLLLGSLLWLKALASSSLAFRLSSPSTHPISLVLECLADATSLPWVLARWALAGRRPSLLVRPVCFCCSVHRTVAWVRLQCTSCSRPVSLGVSLAYRTRHAMRSRSGCSGCLTLLSLRCWEQAAGGTA